MGLFNNRSYINESFQGGFLGSIDTPSIYDGKYDYTIESAMQIVAENEANHVSIMKAMGIAELNAFTEGIDYFALNEGVGSIFDSFVKFLKSIWEKIKAIFRKFIAMIDAASKTSKEFLKKYKKYIMRPNVMKDLKFDGYNFTHVRNNSKIVAGTETATDSIAQAAATKMDGIANASGRSWNSNANFKFVNIMNVFLGKNTANVVNAAVSRGAEIDSGLKDSDTAMNGGNAKGNEIPDDVVRLIEKVDEDFDQVEETIYSKTFEEYASKSTSIDSLDELAKEFFSYYRDDTDSKTELTDDDISSTDIITILSTYDKTKSDIDKVYKKVQKDYEKLIKAAEKSSDDIIKNTPNKSETNAGKKERGTKARDAFNKMLLLCERALQHSKNAELMAINSWLTALTDENNQAKAIAVKLVGRGTTIKESYGYDEYDESFNEGGYASYIRNVKFI